MVRAFLPSLCSAVNTRRGLALENLAPRKVAPVLHSVRELEIRDPQPIDDPMALTEGTTIGPYAVVGLIGQGGMGEVYQARDTKLDRDVALKVCQWPTP